jgi:hypothetical protein
MKIILFVFLWGTKLDKIIDLVRETWTLILGISLNPAYTSPQHPGAFPSYITCDKSLHFSPYQMVVPYLHVGCTVNLAGEKYSQTVSMEVDKQYLFP